VFGIRTTRGHLAASVSPPRAASCFLPLSRSGRAVRLVPVVSGLVLARPSVAQRSSSCGNAAAPRGPSCAASVGRRMCSGASPHSPLRQPRRHGCCPCRAPLLGYPAAAGPSCVAGVCRRLGGRCRYFDAFSVSASRFPDAAAATSSASWSGATTGAGQLALARFVGQLAPRLAWRPCASATPLRLTARAPHLKGRGPQPAPGTPAPNPNCLARI
jgi:hypothetical protein